MIAKWMNFAIDIIPHLMMALFGGIANLIISKKKDEVYGLGFIFGEIFLAMFVSALIYLLMTDMGISGTYIAMACGVTGTMSRRVLNVVQTKFTTKFESN